MSTQRRIRAAHTVGSQIALLDPDCESLF